MITNKNREILGFSSSPKLIKKISMLVINVLQEYKRGDIVVALAVLWVMVCDRFNIDPSDVMNVAYKMRNQTFDNKYDHQFRAIKEYMQHEL